MTAKVAPRPRIWREPDLVGKSKTYQVWAFICPDCFPGDVFGAVGNWSGAVTVMDEHVNSSRHFDAVFDAVNGGVKA